MPNASIVELTVPEQFFSSVQVSGTNRNMRKTQTKKTDEFPSRQKYDAQRSMATDEHVMHDNIRYLSDRYSDH